VIEPFWIDQRDAMTLHDPLLALHCGSQGTRDRSLLQSALARPHQLLAFGSEFQVISLARNLQWLYFEADRHLDVVRLLGDRQDIVASHSVNE